MTIEIERVDDVMRTSGLKAAGRRELEIVGVTDADADEAETVLEAAAEYCTNQKPIASGDVRAVSYMGAGLVMRFVEFEKDETVQKKGFFGKLLSGAPVPNTPLRLISPEPGSAEAEPPVAAVATVMVVSALQLLDEDSEDHDRDEGRAELERAIKYFPGDPEKRDAPVMDGVVYNQENHLAYKQLAEISEGPESAGWYEQAIERSAGLERRELGALAEELEASRGDLVDQTRAIISHNLSTDSFVEEVGPHAAVYRSPLWAPSAFGQLARKASLMPNQIAAMYFDGPGAEALEEQAWVVDVAVDALMKHTAQPVPLLLATREVRKIYFDPGAPWTSSDVDYHAPQGMLSALLADIARRLCAGCTEEEIRAAYGLAEGEDGEAKLVEQRKKEEAWYVESMTAPPEELDEEAPDEESSDEEPSDGSDGEDRSADESSESAEKSAAAEA